MADIPFPNQPAAYEGRNLFLTDPVLGPALARIAGHDAGASLIEWGATLGTPESFALAEAANRFAPQLKTHDPRGERIDTVEFHPAWHALMERAMAMGEHCAPWSAPGPHAHLHRAAMYYLHAQVENGTQCPLTMTYASVPVLNRHAEAAPGLRNTWLPRILAATYDPRSLPVEQKQAALIGMGMTERQGGSDVRSNLTQAALQGDGSARIRGHKWFFSAPQCDAHLVLAQTPEGIGCFFMPRFCADGQRNAIRINRLKDKLGNRSNASAEVEFEDAHAWLLGDPGRGVTTILEMVQLTRLDCVIGSAGMMRGAIAYAMHYAAQRIVFGRVLATQPLMQNVLADLALESEAALLLALRLADCLDAPEASGERALARIAIPAAKYWVCKRAPMVALEAMEVLGGNGYVEEAPLARCYREGPVNSIWEGSGNVICLDVARAAQREPAAGEAVTAALAAVRGANAHLDRALSELATCFTAPIDAFAARRFAQLLASSLAAALLVRHAPPFVADAYCASRLREDRFAGAAFGGLPHDVNAAAIVARAMPTN